ncbi:MAG: diguanylate cyclase domain-containing protein [Bacillota bacterium]
MMASDKRSYVHIAYTLGVTVLGIGLLVRLSGELDLDRSAEFAALVILGILVEWLAVNFPLGRLSGGFSLVLASLLVYNLSASAWISSVAFLIGNGIANRGNPVRTSVFNMSQHVLTLYGSAYLSRALWGRDISGLPLTGINSGLFQLMTLIIFYIVINNIFVYLYTYPGRKGARMHSWRDTLRWDLLSYFFSAPFGVAMALLYREIGMTAALLLFIPILTVQFIMGLYVRSEVVNKELRAVYEITKRLGSQGDFSEIPGVLLKEMRRALPFHTGVVYLWREDSRSFRAAAAYGPYRQQLEKGIVHSGDGFWGWVIHNGEPEIIFDSKIDPRVKSEQGLSQVLRSLLVIPLVGEAGPLGLVIVGEKKAMAFSEHDLQVAVSLCGTLTEALTNRVLSEKMARYRSRDPMTGLLNRNTFLRSGSRVFDALPQAGIGSAALMLLDLDILGRINEAWSQETGDRMIMELGNVLKSLDIPDGVAGRYGDDEFALLLPGYDELKARELAAEIRSSLNDLRIVDENPLISVKVSAGIAVWPDDGESFDNLLKMAGMALKQAKKNGRDRTEAASGLNTRYAGRSGWII